MREIISDNVLWSVETASNLQALKEAGVDFSLRKREVINVCDSAC